MQNVTTSWTEKPEIILYPGNKIIDITGFIPQKSPDIFWLYNVALHMTQKSINVTQQWQYWRKHKTFNMM